MPGRRRIGRIALILCLVYCFAIAFSAFFIAAEADHPCVGEGCPICHEIRSCLHLLSSVLLAGTGACVVFAYLKSSVRSVRFVAVYQSLLTLVSLKVKLSD